MEENIKLNKEVFAKRPYNKIIDTSFNELGVQNIQEQLDAQPTVQEFFDLYTELFYQINELGETNSHEFLIKTSSEYINFDEGNELIEALQLEIANLRKELLQSQQESVNSLLPNPLATNELADIGLNPNSNTRGSNGNSNNNGGIAESFSNKVSEIDSSSNSIKSQGAAAADKLRRAKT